MLNRTLIKNYKLNYPRLLSQIKYQTFFEFSDNELVFLDSQGGLSILDVSTLNQSQIVNNIVFVSTKYNLLFFTVFKLNVLKAKQVSHY